MHRLEWITRPQEQMSWNAMFARNEEDPMARQANASSPNQINMIGDGTVFEGTLTAESDVRVSGRIVGKLKIKGKVIVAQEGSLEGEVKAVNLDVGGHIQGEIDVSERVILKSSARIEGNIRTGRLVVEEGAVFNGKCQMGGRTVDSETIAKKASKEPSVDRPKNRVVTEA